MKKILLYLWQLPQNIVGFILTRFSKATITMLCYDREVIRVYFTKNVFNCGVSLGNYIILDYDVYYNNLVRNLTPYIQTVNHEHGHQKQSRMLGWLYFLVIGLPSACGNLLRRVFTFDYYKQPWEAWADKLGGVVR